MQANLGMLDFLPRPQGDTATPGPQRTPLPTMGSPVCSSMLLGSPTLLLDPAIAEPAASIATTEILSNPGGDSLPLPASDSPATPCSKMLQQPAADGTDAAVSPAPAETAAAAAAAEISSSAYLAAASSSLGIRQATVPAQHAASPALQQQQQQQVLQSHRRGWHLAPANQPQSSSKPFQQGTAGPIS